MYTRNQLYRCIQVHIAFVNQEPAKSLGEGRSQVSKQETKYSQALDTIRRSICLANSDEEMILRETSLAEDFGMSRTPIRQILQRLAYEGLVETRSGVGNVVVPLLPEHRARDFLTHKGILQAALLFDLPDLTIGQHSEIVCRPPQWPIFSRMTI